MSMPDRYDIALFLGALASGFLILFPHSVHMAVFGQQSLAHAYHVLGGVLIGWVTLFYADKRYKFLSAQ